MKHVREYELFESETPLTKIQTDWLYKCTNGTWKVNDWTGLIDIDGNFDCTKQDITDFKGIRFGHVSGYFSCDGSTKLRSLEGSPERIDGDFHCKSTMIESLSGGPLYVGGNYLLNGSRVLKSLAGAPREIKGDFGCFGCGLTTLKGAPSKIGGNFNCRSNDLTSLKGGPKEVGGEYVCSDNKLTSIEGAPNKKIGWLLFAEKNPISDMTIKKLFTEMGKGKSYEDALKKVWDDIPTNDALVLVHREDSTWLTMDMVNQLVQRDPKRSFEIIRDLKKYSSHISSEFDQETNDISDLGDLGF